MTLEPDNAKLDNEGQRFVSRWRAEAERLCRDGL